MRALIRRSTDEVAPDQRVRYWRDTVHDAVVEMDLLPHVRGGPNFFSHIDLCPLRHIVPHQALGSPQKISRDSSEIARGAKSAYYLISQSRVPWRSLHAGQDVMVQPGEAMLIDSRIPYTFFFDEGLDDLSVEMPVEWVERWLPDPTRVIGQPLQGGTGWGLALRGAKEAMVPDAIAGLAVPDELLEDQLGVLLSLASGLCRPVRHDDGLYDGCVGVMRERLSRPGLVASEVAAACSVSLRTLHRAFAAEGRTFAGVLMELRVEAAARLLADARFGILTIAEIARRCGFLDASHFARQFRRLRGVGPREFRAGRG